MIRPLTLVTMLAAMGAGLHVYQTKHEVALLDRELRQIARAIEEQNERMLALSAEWAWLNEPERLRQAAARHLALEPMQPVQFIRHAEMERRLPQAATFEGPPALFAAREDAGAGGGADAPLRLDIPERLPAPGLRISIAAAAPAVAAPSLARPPARTVEAASLAAARADAAADIAPAGGAAPAAPPAATSLAATPAAISAVAPLAVATVAAATLVPRPAAAATAVERPQPPPRAAVTLAVAPRPAPRPAAERQAVPAVAALPPVAGPARPTPAPAVAATGLARTASAIAPPAAAAPPGGSLLGTSRPMLAPPVPFGTANGAAYGSATSVR